MTPQAPHPPASSSPPRTPLLRRCPGNTWVCLAVFCLPQPYGLLPWRPSASPRGSPGSPDAEASPPPQALQPPSLAAAAAAAHRSGFAGAAQGAQGCGAAGGAGWGGWGGWGERGGGREGAAALCCGLVGGHVVAGFTDGELRVW